MIGNRPIYLHPLDDVSLNKHLSLEKLLQIAPRSDISGQAVAMEMLPHNDDNGQHYGWTLYRKHVSSGGSIEINGQVRDRAQVHIHFIPSLWLKSYHD